MIWCPGQDKGVEQAKGRFPRQGFGVPGQGDRRQGIAIIKKGGLGVPDRDRSPDVPCWDTGQGVPFLGRGDKVSLVKKGVLLPLV